MLFTEKRVGETPLELLDRLRIENPELKDEKLSYAGRLDPMAEGQMLILVGEENKEYKKYLKYDKEYIATFLIGIKTDTGDALGLIEETESEEQSDDFLQEQVDSFVNIRQQTYPWFSSQTVDGKKLFDHYKEGNINNIVRPVREVSIKKSEFIKSEAVSLEGIKKYIFESIGKVKGDFRQKEILDKWTKYFSEKYSKNNTDNFRIFEVKLHVSSGTYIRALTEEFGFPVVLLKLKRTKIFVI